jgi:acyl dehydratase
MLTPLLDELKGYRGQIIGHSPWHTISQEMIQAFADAAGDHQWIHVDVERAQRESPWKSPVAHGFLTVSLIPKLNTQVLQVSGTTASINYGMNKLRFPSAVTSGSDIRTRVELLGVDQVDEHRYLASYHTTVEVKGEDKPACVAENLVMYVI